MRYLFLLNPTAGKRDCTAELAPAIQAAAQRAGIPPEKRKVVVTQYAGHARELAAEAAHTAQADGEPVRIWTAGGDGTFMEAMTGVQGFSNAAVGCLPYGSGNDFLRTYGTRAEFTDLDAQLAGREVTMCQMTPACSWTSVTVSTVPSARVRVPRSAGWPPPSGKKAVRSSTTDHPPLSAAQDTTWAVKRVRKGSCWYSFSI